MDVFPKFIVEGDALIIAKCTYHSEIVENKELVKGGGWHRLDSETKTFTLYGDSHDFGKARLEDIKDCVEKGNVFTDSWQCNKLDDKYSLAYDTGTEIIKLR